MLAEWSSELQREQLTHMLQGCSRRPYKEIHHKLTSAWAESRKNPWKPCSEQSEASAFCSQGLLLHTFTSLFDTSATFNIYD